MDQSETGIPLKMSDVEALVQAARLPALRAASDADLRALAAALQLACERTRVRTIRNFAKAAPPDPALGPADGATGFSGFFAALRSTRFEMKRRQSTLSRLEATAARKVTREAVRSAVSRRRAGADQPAVTP